MKKLIKIGVLIIGLLLFMINLIWFIYNFKTMIMVDELALRGILLLTGIILILISIILHALDIRKIKRNISIVLLVVAIPLLFISLLLMLLEFFTLVNF